MPGFLCPHCGARLANRGNLPGHLRRAHGAPKIRRVSASPKFRIHESQPQRKIYDAEIIQRKIYDAEIVEEKPRTIVKAPPRNLQPIIRRVAAPSPLLRSPHFRFRYGSPEAETLLHYGYGVVSGDGQWVSCDAEQIRIAEFTKNLTRERYAHILGISAKTERR